MWEPADVEQAIVDFPVEAEDALGAIQLDPNAKRLDSAAFKVAADVTGRLAERIWVESLDDRGLLERFVRALVARGVPLDLGPIDVGDTNIPRDALTKFVSAAASFGCRIVKDGNIAGSGILVGPTTMLTAWHVVSRAGPKEAQEPYPKIEVLLADGRTVDARVPVLAFSPCGDREYQGEFPSCDAEVAEAHDFAVLRLAQPAGAQLGTAAIPAKAPDYKPSAALLLVHYPAGEDVGIGAGSVCKIRGLSARWSHLIGAQGGSSGGGCFDSSLSLLGIHQGKDPRQRGRLVPVKQFHEVLRAAVANDEAPDIMWSLDGTPGGEFVIGRDRFFQAFTAVHRNPRVRGIRIKRSDAAGDLSGLPFSYRMLDRMVARNGRLRLVRVSFEAAVSDVAAEIARRMTDAGLSIGSIKAAPGVADGQTAPEAVGADRGRHVAALVNQKAAELGVQLWIFIDHPQISFGDEARSALEGFIDAALQCDSLRLAIAGYEAVALPGQDFYDEPYPPDRGARGLMVEILSGYTVRDVSNFLHEALKAANANLQSEAEAALVEVAIDGIPNENGVYPPWTATEVGERLRPEIQSRHEESNP